MRTLEQMDEGMNLEALKRKAAGDDTAEKPAKKTRDDAVIVPVNMEWLRTEPEKLYPLIYGYLKVSWIWLNNNPWHVGRPDANYLFVENFERMGRGYG